MQRVLSEQLASQTRITIAHRLHTVITHKILVMADGTVAQFGYAQELARDQAGHFAKMLEAMGAAAAEQMLAKL